MFGIKMKILALAVCMLVLVSCQKDSGQDLSRPESTDSDSQTATEQVKGVFLAMDTVIEYDLYSTNPSQSVKTLESELEKVDQAMSMHIASSEISKMNARAGTGEYTKLSEDTFTLLSRSKAYYTESGGKFDVTVAPLSNLWNIPSATKHRIPSDAEIEALLPLVSADDIQLDFDNRSAHLAKEGQAVDLGAIAKGYSCDILRRELIESGVTSGYVSVGGNVMVIGKKATGEDYRLGVRDPWGSEADYFAVVTLPDSTMSTSGDYLRFFEEDGVRYHHIFDTATGRPAETDLRAVSILSPDGAYAEFLSTYLFIMGKEYVVSHINEMNCEIIAVDKEKNVYISENLSNRFIQMNKDGSYQYHIVYKETGNSNNELEKQEEAA